ncbi:hypothetical protein B0A48_09133 [Cryoendolithus antarcticus]|uniref:Choline transport protein n=1 Tax=Cryoendolithus antarcticus TaxID=1507870 RepID=A0A1V8T1R0_9PEZI|nr:hypothetical protein B0A48_09133 [Cryoendolithus antarcticus]
MENSPTHIADDATLALLGKKQVLKRRFAFISLFGFAVCELITWETVLALFAQAFSNGGPAGAIYGFMIAWASTLSVYTVISELASMAPIAGGQYYWVYMLAPAKYKTIGSYVIGWLTSLAWTATVATETLFAGTIIQGIMVLDYLGYDNKAWEGTLLTWAVIAGCIFVNVIIPAWLPRFEVFILVFHIAGFIAILVTLLVMTPELGTNASVWQTSLNEGGWPTQGLSYCVGFLGNVATFVGADASVHLAEEVSNAALNIPRAILGAMLINGAVGFAMMVTILYCVGDVKSVLETATGFPFIQVFANSTNNIAGATRVPVNAVLAVTACAALLTLIYIGSYTAFNDVISLTITGFYGSYFLPAALLLYHRIKGNVLPRGSAVRSASLPNEKTTADAEIFASHYDQPTLNPLQASVISTPLIWGPWHIPGIFGIINNAYACTYMVFVIFWSVWPPETPVDASTMNYSVVVTGGVMILSAIWYFVRAKKIYRGPLIDEGVVEVMAGGTPGK